MSYKRCECTDDFDCGWCEAAIDRIEDQRAARERGSRYDVW